MQPRSARSGARLVPCAPSRMPGTEPARSQPTVPNSTVCVMAACAMRSGVMTAPPPMPVRPTRQPTTNPARVSLASNGTP